ncbi:MAG: sigma-54 dependent transcriptional regulator, partial [Planctomycetota bacterium]|nr:sigma-54 dependent transcriptional regulator [Planctomycetota bacterium]
MRVTLLIVGAPKASGQSIERALADLHLDIVRAATRKRARQLLRDRSFDLLLVDADLSDGSGLDLVAKSTGLAGAGILTVRRGDVRTAVRAVKEGVREVLEKPIRPKQLRRVVQETLRSLGRKSRRAKGAGRSRKDGDQEILGQSPAIELVRRAIRKVGPVDSPVLVYGETGTGKELVANWIHGCSSRATRPLLKVNCGRFTESLLESELFGHEKGAFTDAKSATAGLLEQADGGTLLLDEISTMKPDLQVKLLRVVEGHGFRRIGASRDIRTDVRIIAGTNGKLHEEIQSGAFRKDLYYRLNVFEIDLPPLRERGQDILSLARHFLRECSLETLSLSAESEEALLAHDWPGNVRELKNAMTRAATLTESEEIRLEHFPRAVQVWSPLGPHIDGAPDCIRPLAEMEKVYIQRVLSW